MTRSDNTRGSTESGDARSMTSSAQARETYGQALERALTRARLSQKQLAIDAGVVENTIFNLVHDRHAPKQKSHHRIVDALQAALRKRTDEHTCEATLQALQAAFDASQPPPLERREHAPAQGQGMQAPESQAPETRELGMPQQKEPPAREGLHPGTQQGADPSSANPLVAADRRTTARTRRAQALRALLPFAAAGLLLVAILAPIILTIRGAPGPSPSAHSAGQTRPQGNLLAVVQLSATSSGIGAIDSNSGMVQTLILAPDSRGQTHAYIAPAYAPKRHMLAFIAIADNGVRNLELVALRIAQDNEQPPQVVPSTLRIVAANCGPRCNTLAWTPSGDWIIVEGEHGLVAFNPFTRARRSVTVGAHDAWPACSPDGAWLTFQHGVETAGYIEALAAVDCIPVPDAAASAEVVSGYIVAWHPTWSVDGARIAFLARTRQGTQVVVVDARALTQRSGSGSSPVLLSPHPVSKTGCAEPVWATQIQKPQRVLLYVCPGSGMSSGSRFTVLSGANLEVRRTWSSATSPSPQPTIYNPVWIPPARAL